MNSLNALGDANAERKYRSDLAARLNSETDSNQRQVQPEVRTTPQARALFKMPNMITPSNLSDYIFFGETTHGDRHYPDMLISKQIDPRTKGESWSDAQAKILGDGGCLMDLRTYADFLEQLIIGSAVDGNGKKIDCRQVISELDGKGEFLDARFTRDEDNTFRIATNHRFVDNPTELVSVYSDVLDPSVCLLESGDVNYTYWLDNATILGLPPQEIPAGSMKYSAPVFSDSTPSKVAVGRNPIRTTLHGGFHLDCNFNYDRLDATVGARAVHILGGQK